jgi:hypothetical protein
MSAMPGRWRRIAVLLAQHASRVLPRARSARSPWAEAMRRELDYIEDDRAALHWAIGCVTASYTAHLVVVLRFWPPACCCPLRWRSPMPTIWPRGLTVDHDPTLN